MSLSAALNTAVIGLTTLQQQTRIVSGNISNAQNENYSRKIANLTTPVADGLPQAALIASITRVVAPEVRADLYKQAGEYGKTSTQLQYARDLAEILDATVTTGEQPTLMASMTRFENAWKALEATPEDMELRNQVILRAEELTAEIRRLYNTRSTLETRARQNIQADIQTINEAAAEIAKLNTQVALQKASGGITGDFEDLRDQQIAKIAERVGIRTLTNDRGEVFVYTNEGVQIVGSIAQEFTYDPSTGNLTVRGGTQPLNSGFKGGSIQASLDYIEPITLITPTPAPPATAAQVSNISSDPNVQTLAKFFNQLDAFAANLVQVVNTAYGGNFFNTPTPGAEGGDIMVEETAATLNPAAAGAVQQAMRMPDALLRDYEVNPDYLPAGGLPAGRVLDPNGLKVANINIFGLASAILSYHARNAADTEVRMDTAERQHHALDQKLRNLTGVNIDDELAQLQLLTTNYAALANVMNTITEMFDQLVNIGR
ncbi:flagellar hook-associated protein FlgK [uncultured Ferrovibrio sp.]|jgi:flagellar hook-associated protein 1 FlgK|uniref:flagellar hook-associated protein FlgK n=1 Tax=uncultured Ferrovibrio sp. TaxID=1576913 RepID=UPI002615CFCF|nr:flagellar hook-associated protein FlgK [uncultured Ferrovibrio sp.]